MAWIPAAISGILGITGMISQNTQNKAAIKNNDQQQQQALGNAAAAHNQAKSEIAPWVNPQNAPLANRQISQPGQQFASPGAGAYGIGGGGQLNAASVMQGPPGQPPQQQGQMQPPGGAQGGGPNPQMLAMFMQFLQHAMGQGGAQRQAMPIQRAPAPPMAPPQVQPPGAQPQPFNMRQAQ